MLKEISKMTQSQVSQVIQHMLSLNSVLKFSNWAEYPHWRLKAAWTGSGGKLRKMLTNPPTSGVSASCGVTTLPHPTTLVQGSTNAPLR